MHEYHFLVKTEEHQNVILNPKPHFVDRIKQFVVQFLINTQSFWEFRLRLSSKL